MDDFIDNDPEAESIINEYQYNKGEQPDRLSKDTYLYTIVDLKDKVRGPDNYYCKFNYQDIEECKKALIELETPLDEFSNKLEISRRNKIELDIDMIASVSNI